MNRRSARRAIAGVCRAPRSRSRPEANDVAQANNPLADVKAFNVHNYYIGKLTETDTYANQFWLRYAQPFSIGESKWLMRASLPVMTNPVLPGTEHQDRARATSTSSPPT